MLDQSTRAAILKLRQQEHSIRGIARALRLSRGAVCLCQPDLAHFDTLIWPTVSL
jgi:hypothetical protein